MSQEKSTITNDIEELLNKTIEANKFFLSEGANIFKQFSKTNSTTKNVNFLQNENITNAFNAYLKLNLQHAKNLIDLGVGLVKQSISATETNTASTTRSNTQTEANPNAAEVINEPAFILKAEVLAGEKAQLQFVLDNVKEQDVVCKLINSKYIFQQKNILHKEFETLFTPQAFNLKSGEQQTVKISIATDKKCLSGLYISHVQVHGFEPAFFSIHLTVLQNKPKAKVNGRKK